MIILLKSRGSVERLGSPQVQQCRRLVDLSKKARRTETDTEVEVELEQDVTDFVRCLRLTSKGERMRLLDALDDAAVARLAEVADYLECEQLVDLVGEHVRRCLRGKTAEALAPTLVWTSSTGGDRDK